MPARNPPGRRATPFRLHTRTPWVTKLRPEARPKLVPHPQTGVPMLVPTPLLVAEEIRKVRRGQLITVAQLRNRLGRRFGAQSCCPFTTGIFLHIVAGATEEDVAAGRRPTAPYWRVVDKEGRLNPKWPPGPARQAAHLREEGHRVVRGAQGEFRIQNSKGKPRELRIEN